MPKATAPERKSLAVQVLVFNVDMKIPGATFGKSLKASHKHKIEHVPANGGFPAKYRVHYNAGDVKDQLDIESHNVASVRYAK